MLPDIYIGLIDIGSKFATGINDGCDFHPDINLSDCPHLILNSSLKKYLHWSY
jgi:hypothetical protein